MNNFVRILRRIKKWYLSRMKENNYVSSMYEGCDLYLKHMANIASTEEEVKYQLLFEAPENGSDEENTSVRKWRSACTDNLLNERLMLYSNIDGSNLLSPKGEFFIRSGGYKYQIERDDSTYKVSKSVISTNQTSRWFIGLGALFSLGSFIVAWLTYTGSKPVELKHPVEIILLPTSTPHQKCDSLPPGLKAKVQGDSIFVK